MTFPRIPFTWQRDRSWYIYLEPSVARDIVVRELGPKEEGETWKLLSREGHLVWTLVENESGVYKAWEEEDGSIHRVFRNDRFALPENPEIP